MEDQDKIVEVLKTAVTAEEEGDGSWTKQDCGCGHTIGTDGVLYVMSCDTHTMEEIKSTAIEVRGL